MNDWKAAERKRYAAMQATDAYQDAKGVWRWKSNDQVPPDDVLDTWNLDDVTLAATVAARVIDTRIAIDRYLTMRKAMTRDQLAEERAEARAAFGPDVVVENVLSGERWKT